MALSREQQRQLEELNRLAKEPAPAPVGKSVNISVDLGDAEQVKRAQKYGFLPADEEEAPEGDAEGEEEDEPPRRRGYFADN